MSEHDRTVRWFVGAVLALGVMLAVNQYQFISSNSARIVALEHAADRDCLP